MIRGYDIDLVMASRKEAYAHGRRKLLIIIDRG